MKIGIVGAGPAGLQAAWLLQELGHETTVFEARSRVGGRLETISLEGGGFYESGAEWLDADHARTMALIRSFGLEPAAEAQWPGRLLFNGAFAPEDEPWPDAVEDAEAVHSAAAELIRRLPDNAWDAEEAGRLDLQTLSDFLDRHCVSPRGRWLCEAIQRSDEGEDTDQVGLLGWLVGYRHYLSRQAGDMSSFRIPGGAQRLCERMAERLARPVALERALRSVSAGEDHVELWMDGEAAFFDLAVLAIPPRALAEVEFLPEVSPEKEAAWHALGMARAIKAALVFDRPFWEGSPRLLSDLPFQQVWSGGQEGAHVLSAYVCGAAAEALRGQKDAVGSLVRALEEAMPGARAAFREGRIHDWIGDPWCQGAFTSLAPGSVLASLPHLREPEGRLHFAGEHTADWLGFIEGALESAERVAIEIGS